MRHVSIFILSLWTTFAFQANAQTDSLLTARTLISQGRNSEALAILDELTNQQMIRNDALMFRSQAYFQLGEYDKSFLDASEMLKEKEHLTENQLYNAYWNAGVSLVIQGHFNQALEYVVSAQKLNKKDLKVNQTLALVYMNLGRFDEAMRAIKDSEKIARNHFGNYKLLGQLYLMKGELEKALVNYDKCISINPNYAPAYENRATVKLKLNDKEGACTDLKTALSLGVEQVASVIEEICQ
jgi:tetratricopeptide (TPR) repeat protein